jgi:DNA-binding MarR family transcriptional regulator
MSPALKDELKQKRPFHSLAEEAFLNVARTAAVLEHDLSRALRPHGITLTQYNVLRILRGAGAAGLCRNEVGERLVTRVPDVTRLLDRMEEMKLIARERGTDDRRYVTTTIARRGLDLVNRLDAEVGALQERRFSHLDKAETRTLVDLLTRLRSSA